MFLSYLTNILISSIDDNKQVLSFGKSIWAATYIMASLSPFLIGLSMTLVHHCLSVNGSNRRKQIRDHKSFIEFWIGVPVTTHLLSACSSWIFLVCKAFGFLMQWPSSRTMRSHFVCIKADSCWKDKEGTFVASVFEPWMMCLEYIYIDAVVEQMKNNMKGRPSSSWNMQ